VRGAVTLQTGLSFELAANVVRDASTTQRFASERHRPSRPCNLSASLRVCKPPLTRDRYQSLSQVRRSEARLRRAADVNLKSSGTPQNEQQTSGRRAEGRRTVPQIARTVIAIAGCCDGWSTLRSGFSLDEPVENYDVHFDEATRLTPRIFSWCRYSLTTTVVSAPESSTPRQSVTLMVRAPVRFW
jgi:hypothetical protein